MAKSGLRHRILPAFLLNRKVYLPMILSIIFWKIRLLRATKWLPLRKDLLDPAHLSRIEDFSLLAKVVVDGAMPGIHRSLRQGGE